MNYLFWCSSTVSALVLAFIFLRSSSVPPAPSPATPSPSTQPPSTLLHQAQLSASRDRLKAAIALIDRIPLTDPTYATAQPLRELWARELLQRAINKYAQTEVPIALKMLTAIPVNTSSYAQSTQLIALWQKEAKVLQRASPQTGKPLPKVATPKVGAIIQPSLQPAPPQPAPPPRLSPPPLSPPSEATRQADQAVLETLSTLPAHWSEPRAATPAEIASWVAAAPAISSSSLSSSLSPSPSPSQPIPQPVPQRTIPPIPTAINLPVPTPSPPESFAPSLSSRIDVLPPDAANQ